VWMRGGTSKGLFLHLRDLPPRAKERDALLLCLIGSPDPYGKHTDGLGGATSSTSKVKYLCDAHSAQDQPEPVGEHSRPPPLRS
jgi:2-methylaconitate isomerase